MKRKLVVIIFGAISILMLFFIWGFYIKAKQEKTSNIVVKTELENEEMKYGKVTEELQPYQGIWAENYNDNADFIIKGSSIISVEDRNDIFPFKIVNNIMIVMYDYDSDPMKYDILQITKDTLILKNPDGSITKLYKRNPNSTCHFETYLNDPKIPQLAKAVYLDKEWNLNDLSNDDGESILIGLESKNRPSRSFYVKVLTKMYSKADGAFSERLGNSGKEYIENNTKEFASNFDNIGCFTDKDLETWADIALLEFGTIGYKGPGDYDKAIVDNYNRKLNINCKDCSINQKTTIDTFSNLLKTKWQDYLKNK